jgi:hypothetical protein
MPVVTIDGLPNASEMLRRIADNIDSGFYDTNKVVVVMSTPSGIELFGNSGVTEEFSIQLLERGKQKFIRMMDT